MKTTNKKINEETVKETSFWKKRAADDLCLRVEKYQKDEQKDQRVNQSLCKYCFYLQQPSLAMQSFWEWNCGVCDKPSMASSSATPLVCKECSQEHHLCQECGSNLDLDKKRIPSIK